MHTQFAEIWQNLVTEQEFLSTNFPNQYRTLEECLLPFQESQEALGGLSIVSSETDIVPCPFFDAYKMGDTKKCHQRSTLVALYRQLAPGPTAHLLQGLTTVVRLGERRVGGCVVQRI